MTTPKPKRLTKSQVDAKELDLCRQEIARMEGVISTQQEVINTFKKTIHLLSKNPYTYAARTESN